MARQTITIPAADIDVDVSSTKNWTFATRPEIIDDLTPAGADRFLGRIGWYSVADEISMNLASTPIDDQGNRNLTTDWESSAVALTFEQGSNSVTIPGPTNSSNQTSDSTEDYNFGPSVANVAALDQFFLTDLDTSLDLTLILDDGALPDASAPTSVVIVGGNSVDSEGTLSLGATVSGGTYDTLAYAWDDGGAGGSFSTQTAATIYTAPAATSDTAVTLTCTVTATGDGTNANDGTSDEATGTKNITVNAADLMPTAPSVDDQAGFVGQVTSAITLPEGTGGDGTLTYALSGLPAGLSFSASNRQITGTPTTAGEYTVTYTVTDADSDSDDADFTYRIAGFDDSGLDVVVFVQVVIESTSADYYVTGGTDGGETVGTVDLAVDDVDITIDRVRNRNSGQQVLLRRTGAGSWMTEFENAGGEYNTGGWQFTFALATGNIVMDVPGDVNSGTNAINLRLDIPSGEQSNFNDLTEGHPFILALSMTTPTTTDHAIDGGDISWTFELPEPDVTHVLAAGTTDHEISGGNINWTFELPQPDVTHRLAPVDHTIDGGDINWAFSLPRPRGTHMKFLAPIVPVAPRINDQPFRDALISQWRSGSIAPQLIDVMLTATDRLYIANVNLLLKGLDIDALHGVLLDFAGYRFGIRRPLVDTVSVTARDYFGFDGTGNTPPTGSFDEAPFFSQNAFSDSKVPLVDRFFRSLVKLAAFNKIGVKTNEKCLGALKTVYPDGYIQDNLDLSITYFVDDSAMMLSVLIGEMNLWPKPAGIAYDVMAIP